MRAQEISMNFRSVFYPESQIAKYNSPNHTQQLVMRDIKKQCCSQWDHVNYQRYTTILTRIKLYTCYTQIYSTIKQIKTVKIKIGIVNY